MISSSLTPLIWWIAPISALIALITAGGFYRAVMRAPAGNDRMREIAGYVREGALAYLRRQYRVVFIVFVVLFVVLALLA